ncbi:MAG: metalloregulator ArsR/SmtB family transcription factor [Thermoanaerobaculia bacterium]
MKCVGPTIAAADISRIRQSMEFSPELEEAAELFSLANNSTRLKMIYLLHELKELCVCDLGAMLNVSVSAISQHLAKLRAYGLVTSRRDAQTIYYRLTRHSFLMQLRTLILDQIKLDREMDAAGDLDSQQSKLRMQEEAEASIQRG